MYILRIDHVRYASDPTDRTPFTLVTALRTAYGCGNAHIERADGTTVVADAGRAFTPRVHAPTGRTLRTGGRRYPAPHWCARDSREGPFDGLVRWWCDDCRTPVSSWEPVRTATDAQ